MLPLVQGDFVAVSDPELKFSGEGKPWAKIRAVAKDRKRTADGQWEDGETCFIDLLVSGKAAENAAESIVKGDPMVVTGRLILREWETNEGRKMSSYSIRADEIGVSLKFQPARSQRAQESMRPAAVQPVQSDEAPF